MYKKFLEEMIKRVIENKFDVTTYRSKISFCEETKYPHFSIKTLRNSNCEAVDFKGFVGNVGQVVITNKDGKNLKLENYITVN